MQQTKLSIGAALVTNDYIALVMNIPLSLGPTTLSRRVPCCN